MIELILTILVSVTSIKANDNDSPIIYDLFSHNDLSLNMAIQEAKLLPSPNGVGGSYSDFGTSVHVEGNVAVIGAPNAGGSGVAYIFEFNGINWEETQLLRPTDGKVDDSFGYSVSLSGDKIIIGAIESKVNSIEVGSAYIFNFSNGIWSQSAKLIATDGNEFDGFGLTVSLSGNRALIGSFSGSAYVFDFSNNTWQQSSKLTPTDNSTDKAFGASVSLYGNRALIGAYRDGYNGLNTGSAYIFDFKNGEWSQTAKLTADDGSLQNKFGHSVSLNGNKLAIGASGDNRYGSVYIFDFSANNWIQSAKLIPNDFHLDGKFGNSITLDNNTIVIGAQHHLSDGAYSGYAYIFNFSNNNWSQTTKLITSNGNSSDIFINSVSISGDTVLIGSRTDNDIGSNSGSVYIYNNSISGWFQKEKLVASIGANGASFASSISVDKNRILIGAMYDENTGAAYIFDYLAGKWSLTTKLKANDGVNADGFGASVSLENNRALIGAYRSSGNVKNSGSVYVFELSQNGWLQTNKIYTEDGSFFDGFGGSVSLFGNRVLIGASSDDDIGNASGSAYIFELINNNWVKIAKLIPTTGEANDFFGTSVSLENNRALVSSPGDNENNENSGAAYIFDFIGNSWSQTAKLKATDGAIDDNFGVSLDIDGDVALIGANLDDDNGENSGSAYIFELSGSDWLQTNKLTPNDGINGDNFGVSVSIDTNSVLIGTNYINLANIRFGTAYIFDYISGNWSQAHKLIANDGDNGDNGDTFGSSVSLSGNKAIISAINDDDHGTNSGAAYIFNRDIIFLADFEKN